MSFGISSLCSVTGGGASRVETDFFERGAAVLAVGTGAEDGTRVTGSRLDALPERAVLVEIPPEGEGTKGIGRTPARHQNKPKPIRIKTQKTRIASRSLRFTQAG